MSAGARLSEKTLELNICSQLHRHVYPKFNLLWFGLTQKQERSRASMRVRA